MCMTCNLSTHMSTRKRLICTQTLAGLFLLMTSELQYCRYLSILGVVYVGKDIRGHMNSTCVKLNIPSTCVCFSPAGSSGTLKRTLEDAKITPAFNPVSLSKVC